MLIRDAEYRDALAEKLSIYDNDIFVNIVKDKSHNSSDSLILTDIAPSEIDTKVLDSLKQRIVFLTVSAQGIPEGFNHIFKYCSISSMISELSYIYSTYHGSGPVRDHSARLIMICSENDALSADKCLSFARQIIYRQGGSVIIIPLSYYNDYGITDAGDSHDSFGRLIYSVHTGRERENYSYTYTDSYGVSVPMLSRGLNRIAYLDSDDLNRLVSGLAARFDTVIGDTATCFRDENIALMKDSDNVVYFETGRRTADIADMLGPENSGKLSVIRVSGDTEEAIAIDDCIKGIYGIGTDGDIESKDNRKVR
ncbi:MAG: hypothetical protein IJ251_07505 [Oscillospiraceae bacterium]|nr:hypothetical protein [Oscillospiraceae bacterium]